jgi:hypothetical protein
LKTVIVVDTFTGQENSVTVDIASDTETRSHREVTGYLFTNAGGAVSWTSHKQSTVPHSTMEAEYMALSDASREAIARFHLYHELGYRLPLHDCLSISVSKQPQHLRIYGCKLGRRQKRSHYFIQNDVE